MQGSYLLFEDLNFLATKKEITTNGDLDYLKKEIKIKIQNQFFF